MDPVGHPATPAVNQERTACHKAMAVVGVIFIVGGVVAAVSLRGRLGKWSFAVAGGGSLIGLSLIAGALLGRSQMAAPEDVKKNIDDPAKPFPKPKNHNRASRLSRKEDREATLHSQPLTLAALPKRCSGKSCSRRLHPVSIFVEGSATALPHDQMQAALERVRAQEEFTPAEAGAIGALLGLAIGDSIGAPYEFLPFKKDLYADEDQYRTNGRRGEFCMQFGQFTDDTSQALCLADLFLLEKGFIDDRKINGQLLWRLFIGWWEHGLNSAFKDRVVGLGGQTGVVMRETGNLGDGEFVAPPMPPHSYDSGNGSLMRGAASALVAKDIDEARRLAREQSKTSHSGEEAAACCELMAWMLYQLVHDAIDFDQLDFDAFNCSVDTVNRLARSEKDVPNPHPRHHQQRENWNWRDPEFTFERLRPTPTYAGSYVMDAMAMALHCMHSTGNFEEAVTKASLQGGDADTVAAIVGQIAGAHYGYASIPEKWVTDLHQWDGNGEIAARALLLLNRRN